jgi:hypothetical protein
MPPEGIASRAFIAILTTICSTCAGEILTNKGRIHKVGKAVPVGNFQEKQNSVDSAQNITAFIDTIILLVWVWNSTTEETEKSLIINLLKQESL